MDEFRQLRHRLAPNTQLSLPNILLRAGTRLAAANTRFQTATDGELASILNTTPFALERDTSLSLKQFRVPRNAT